jgi:hypothetical protein
MDDRRGARGPGVGPTRVPFVLGQCGRLPSPCFSEPLCLLPASYHENSPRPDPATAPGHFQPWRCGLGR